MSSSIVEHCEDCMSRMAGVPDNLMDLEISVSCELGVDFLTDGARLYDIRLQICQRVVAW